MYARCTDGAVPYYVFQENKTLFFINPVFRESPTKNRPLYARIEPVVILTDPEAAFVYLKTHTILSECVKTQYKLRILITLPLVNYLLSFWDCFNLKKLFMTVPFEAVATDVSISINGVSVRFVGPLEVHFIIDRVISKCVVSCTLSEKLVPRSNYYVSRISELHAFVSYLVAQVREGEKASTNTNIPASIAIDSMLWGSFIFLIRLLDFTPVFDIQKNKHTPDNSSVKGIGDSFKLQALVASGKIIPTNLRVSTPKDRTIIYFKDPKSNPDKGIQDALPMPINISTCWIGAREVPMEELNWDTHLSVVPIVYPTFIDLLLNRPDVAFGPCGRLGPNCQPVELIETELVRAEETPSERFEL